MRWALAAGAALLVLTPLALVPRAQAAQVAWLSRPGAGSALRLLHAFLGPGGPVFWTCLVLALAALPGPRRLTLASVALPWAVVPPLTLLAVSRLRPVYDDRYVLYALAGAPLLVAAGADRVLRSKATRSPLIPLAGTLAVALAFTRYLPLHRQDRTLRGRPDTLAAVAALAAREVRPGEAVVFLPSIGRRAKVSYPDGFRGVRDVALKASGPASGTFYGCERGAAGLRRELLALDRLWVLAEPYALRSPWYPRNPVERVKLTVVTEEFVPSEPRREFVRDGVTLRLYTRRPAGALPTPCPCPGSADRPAPPPGLPSPERR